MSEWSIGDVVEEKPSGGYRLSVDVMDRLIEFLEAEKPLTAHVRKQLLEVLEWACLQHYVRRRGHPGSSTTWDVAYTAVALVDRYGATHKAAVGAVLTKRAPPKMFNRVLRAMTKIKAGKAPFVIRVDEKALQGARARLK